MKFQNALSSSNQLLNKYLSLARELQPEKFAPVLTHNGLPVVLLYSGRTALLVALKDGQPVYLSVLLELLPGVNTRQRPRGRVRQPGKATEVKHVLVWKADIPETMGISDAVFFQVVMEKYETVYTSRVHTQRAKSSWSKKVRQTFGHPNLKSFMITGYPGSRDYKIIQIDDQPTLDRVTPILWTTSDKGLLVTSAISKLNLVPQESNEKPIAENQEPQAST